MFDTTNPYALRIEIAGGITHYYVSFKDGQSVPRETEVSRPVYIEFLRFVRIERNLRRWDERHVEQSDLTDETLFERSAQQPKGLEETVFDSLRNDHLRQAVQSLPEKQRRRFVLYHEFGLTYDQIAKMEGCTKVAVKYAIDKAKESVMKKTENFSD